MKNTPKIGLLGCYLKLYDETAPERRPEMDAFYHRIAAEYERRGLEVLTYPLARIAPEFDAAVRHFEENNAEAIVTLHPAYSPSLESVGALAATGLPVVVLDTTPDYEFGFGDTDKTMFNHGIHGVQDLCNLLLRRRKPFLICAGHWEHSGVLDRSVKAVHSARMARKLATARIGSVGGTFEGMGDFRVPPGTFGMEVVPFTGAEGPSRAEIDAEKALDAKRFRFGKFPPGAYERTLVESFRIRHWLETEKLDAFTLCFPGIDRSGGWSTVPFLEASKAMARGIGYAGEGDILTAALTAALNRVFREVSFTEMFCPDWSGNRIFLSHMGEINISLTEHPPLLYESAYKYSDTHAPVQASGCFKRGRAVLANLAPTADSFILVAAEVTLDAPGHPPDAGNQGWFTPPVPVAEFLEQYSRFGGTHHLALIYDGDMEILSGFAHFMGWQSGRISP